MAGRRARGWWWLSAGAFGAALIASCGEAKETLGPVEITTSASSGAGGAGGQGGHGGAAGAGGTSGGGGAPACESGRDPCKINPDPDAATGCCAAGEQCCQADAYGYTDGDRCRPAGEPCPVACPGGADVCPLGTYCKLDPATQKYGCESACTAATLCGFNVCCPVGTGCKNGACPLPDITIDQPLLASSVSITSQHFDANSCEIQEGCVGAPGDRTLLYFDTRTPNVGEGDLVLGHPQGNPLFMFSSCHHHFHFAGYSKYELRTTNGNLVVAGHKQAFCLEDLDPNVPNPPPSKFTCNDQGITRGWADIYSAGLPCQWIDITGVAPGDYQLYVEINPEHVVAESDYSNNSATVPVTIPVDSCPGGCRSTDDTCCRPDDPCGWANDGSCDCGGYFGWDAADCGSCAAFDCGLGNTCPGGCTPDGDPTCCVAGDPCGLADDGVCQCAGTQAWDAGDCANCTTQEADCPAPPLMCNGCIIKSPNDPCCAAGDICNWAHDGYCDCQGIATADWDTDDCALCTGSGLPDCP